MVKVKTKFSDAFTLYQVQDLQVTFYAKPGFKVTKLGWIIGKYIIYDPNGKSLIKVEVANPKKQLKFGIYVCEGKIYVNNNEVKAGEEIEIVWNSKNDIQINETKYKGYVAIELITKKATFDIFPKK